MSVTVRTPETMKTCSLRRGFLPVNDEGDVLSPSEFKILNHKRISELSKLRSEQYEKLGRPNRKNFTLKYKGKEQRLGRNQYIAKRYFDLGDQIEDVKRQSRQVNEWLEANNCYGELNQLELLVASVYSVVERPTGDKIIAKYRELQEKQGFDEKSWLDFFTSLLEQDQE